MTQIRDVMPETQAILRARETFRKVVGVATVRTENCARARAVIEALLAAIGADENQPLAHVLDYPADQVAA